MIYVDSSVLLAQLLAEDEQPPASLWDLPLVTSRLAQYEVWTRLNARGLSPSHGEAAARLLGRLHLVELLPFVLARALDPFPSPVRTLDALHLASMEFLRAKGLRIELAAYDERLASAARELEIPRHLL
jgi:predicted nucleic acid-binding protein